MKTTDPVGTAAAGDMGETAAVNVTDWPGDDGSRLEVRPTVAPSLFTAWVRTAEAEAP
jgi:hypothetical protein